MTRLYYPEALSTNRIITLQDDHVHYLRNVLRQEVGAEIHLFNGTDGEWIGHIGKLTKSQGEVVLDKCLRTAETETPVMLLFSPIKNDALHYLIEKCTEIGITIFQPVIMERSNIHKINQEKLQRIAIESSQQCERLSVPEVRNLQRLSEALDNWPEKTILYCCAERLTDQSKTSAPITDLSISKASLIGPEGGIHPKEMDLLSRYPFVKFISLGKNILRAETAAVVAATKMIL